MVQADHISVVHGSLTVDVPRKIFKGPECTIDEDAAGPFRKMVQDRYPWVSDNSMNVLLNKARLEMIRVKDEETKGRSHSMDLASKGKLDDAIAHMKRHLEMDPEDADSWYALGELLCKAGKADEGYRAFNRGRELFSSSPKRKVR